MSLPFPLTGTTLITGPANVGKTRLTARALDAWLESAPDSLTVVFEFGPAIEHDGRILGGRLSQFTSIPDTVWHGILDAHAPRAAGGSAADSVALARDNAERAARLFTAAPSAPEAVFVNDATIPFQHPRGEIDWFFEYCRPASVVVVNAFESTELGTNDPVSRQETAALARLKEWADRIHPLADD